MTDQTAGHREPSAPSRGSVANHDAVPAAITVSDEARTDKAATSHRRDRSGNTPVAESATPDGYAYTGWPYPKGKAASISDAEIDALEFVVERGRIASQMDYGVLRSLLVRLRPEWLDRPEPLKDCDSYRPRAIERTQQTHTTPAECSKQGDGTSGPVGWWLKGSEYDTGCEYEYVSLLKENAEAAAAEGGTVVPLYRSPTLTDEEREAVGAAIGWIESPGVGDEAMPEDYLPITATLRGLLERLK